MKIVQQASFYAIVFSAGIFSVTSMDSNAMVTDHDTKPKVESGIKLHPRTDMRTGEFVLLPKAGWVRVKPAKQLPDKSVSDAE